MSSLTSVLHGSLALSPQEMFHLLPVVLQVLERTVSEEELRKKKKKMESKANDYKKATFIAICAKRQVCLADTILRGDRKAWLLTTACKTQVKS